MQGEKKKRKRKRNQSKGKELPGAEAGGQRVARPVWDSGTHTKKKKVKKELMSLVSTLNALKQEHLKFAGSGWGWAWLKWQNALSSNSGTTKKLNKMYKFNDLTHR